MNKTVLTLATLAGVGLTSLTGIAAIIAPASASPATQHIPSHAAAEPTTTGPDDVDPALQAWYDNDGTGARPVGVKDVGSLAEVRALQTSADVQGNCFRDAGYDIPIADTAAGEGVQIPEHVAKTDMDRCMTLGQNTYDSEYERLGGK